MSALDSKKDWYKNWWGVILAILFLPFFAVWYVWAKTSWKPIYKLGASLIIVLMVIPFYSRTHISTDSTLYGVSNTNVPVVSSTETKADYEVVNESAKGGLLTMDIYTPAVSDSNIITLNDMLLEKYKPGKEIVFIRYFDDKTIAKDYFKKQLDESISEEEKNRLYTHFIADMKYNTTTGYKQLVKQGVAQTVLKQYQ